VPAAATPSIHWNPDHWGSFGLMVWRARCPRRGPSTHSAAAMSAMIWSRRDACRSTSSGRLLRRPDRLLSSGGVSRAWRAISLRSGKDRWAKDGDVGNRVTSGGKNDRPVRGWLGTGLVAPPFRSSYVRTGSLRYQTPLPHLPGRPTCRSSPARRLKRTSPGQSRSGSRPSSSRPTMPS